jgi:integrase
MASITKQKSGWRAQVYVRGVRDSTTVSTKAEAQSWAAARETELRRMVETGVNTDKTMQDAFDRYATEVSAHKKTSAAEQRRILALANHEVGKLGRLGSLRLCAVTPEVLGAWRDSRLKVVSGSTIVRDMNLLSHVFSTARREWRWIATSPTTDTRRPGVSKARDRRISDAEAAQICEALGFDGGPARTKMQAVAVAFLFAIETAMRAGEICNLLPGDIIGRTAILRDTKNGTSRAVALSTRARELIGLLPESAYLFGLSSSSLDALFRKARDNRTTIEGLTFHDTRHEAITRLARKLDVLDLARMVGHRDIKQLMTYYNASAEDIAGRLD